MGFATVEMPFQAGQHVNCTFANHDAYLRTGTSNGPAVWASSRPLMLPDGQLVWSLQFATYASMTLTPILLPSLHFTDFEQLIPTIALHYQMELVHYSEFEYSLIAFVIKAILLKRLSMAGVTGFAITLELV